MEKLLYINNYNCTNILHNGEGANHLWGTDILSKYYDITCAKLPAPLFKKPFKGSYLLNTWYISICLFLKYWNYPIVYCACGDYVKAFAVANCLHLGYRKLYMIQHHGPAYPKDLPWWKGYTNILFISNYIKETFIAHSKYKYISWGGDLNYIEKFKHNHQNFLNVQKKYDFISAGKSGRDHECLVKAAKGINGHIAIVAAINNISAYDKEKITILSGTHEKKNSTSYDDTLKLYLQSKFIVIPIEKRPFKRRNALSGLTTFVDAAALGIPVLISDNTNMGIDVEALEIGFTYKCGDIDDMRKKMKQMIDMPDEQYQSMCKKMKSYGREHDYYHFCLQLLSLIR